MTTLVNIPKWKISGDWFDVCKCNIPCPCEFAQTPSYGDCDGVLAYHINNGNYGETTLDRLNVLALASFEGNICPCKYFSRDFCTPIRKVISNLKLN